MPTSTAAPVPPVVSVTMALRRVSQNVLIRSSRPKTPPPIPRRVDFCQWSRPRSDGGQVRSGRRADHGTAGAFDAGDLGQGDDPPELLARLVPPLEQGGAHG